jgi:hypothetical protein
MSATVWASLLLAIPGQKWYDLPRPDLSRFRPVMKRHVEIRIIPPCLRPEASASIIVDPDGSLVNVRGREIDFETVGALMKGKKDGTPCTVDVAVWNESKTSFLTLFKTLRKLKEGKDTLSSELERGPANAIVYVHLNMLDPCAYWYTLRSYWEVLRPLFKPPAS